ncbi:MAG: hypothetical protein LBG58_07195 [Planctomycetaceae bacterium]|nr:hypothetical protein [Planctomycetaceae bacterium]
MMRILATLFFCLSVLSVLAADDLKNEFARPGLENRPWVYWFWNNGNLTKEGITADLEAMANTGIGGVLIMEVGQGAPAGPIDFLSDQWRELFQFMIQEANRYGIEVNMNNDAGWNGSGGKWIKPEHGMQILTWSETNLTGQKPEKIVLPEPPKKLNYYRDIAFFAFPTLTGNAEKKGVDPNRNRRATPDNKAIIAQKDVIDLTDKWSPDGTLDWNVPAGNWTILRIGHTCKGVLVHPAPTNGAGLECDKLSIEASEIAFEGQMGKLIADNKAFAGVGKTLMSTHIDSWENGSQNWTPKMRNEFQQRRKYDLWKYLPVFAGYVIDSTEITDRFLWDFRRTVSEMCLDNHVATFKRLANQHGLKLSIEAYDQAPCDFLQFAGMSDEPMGEFWCGGNWASEGMRLNDCRGMASAGHLYSKKIIGAEAFTATNQERWLKHPGTIKSLGDKAFAEGINRFVFHRYSFQPWRDIKPGLMMGPWGIHYERTQTWWSLTPVWHEYLSRCQFMLRQGDFVADIAYVEAEDSPQHYAEHPKNGYQWDQCGTHAVLQMSVKNGKLTLSSGANYEILVLPNATQMTIELLKKTMELVKNGATVIGNRPDKALGLTNYPQKDQVIKELAAELWGNSNEKTGERNYAKGKIVWGKSPETVLAEKGICPDFLADKRLSQIHRRTADTDLYFVANPSDREVLAQISCRATGKPEIWNPETGKIVSAPIYRIENEVTSLVLPFEPSQSLFVVFTKQNQTTVKNQPDTNDPIVAIVHNGEQIVGLTASNNGNNTPKINIKILNAKYGPPNDEKRTVDVRELLQKILDAGENYFTVARLARDFDPAYKVLKTLNVEYELNGKTGKWSGNDNHVVNFTDIGVGDSLCFKIDAANENSGLIFCKSGHYELQTVSGKKIEKEVTIPKPFEINGLWTVQFPIKGTIKETAFDKLISWSDSPDETIKYFSGTAVYRKTFNVPKDFLIRKEQKQRVFLNLGRVNEIAVVKLNGKEQGILWTLTKTVDITDALKPDEENVLEIQVTNLWCNRLIGDARLPQDKERQPNGTLSAWPEWLQKGQPDPYGRETFCMWNLWKKDDALQPSGLLGPVQIIIGSE